MHGCEPFKECIGVRNLARWTGTIYCTHITTYSFPVWIFNSAGASDTKISHQYLSSALGSISAICFHVIRYTWSSMKICRLTQQYGRSRPSIPTTSTDFLNVCFNIGWGSPVHDMPNIWRIKPHGKCNCCKKQLGRSPLHL